MTLSPEQLRVLDAQLAATVMGWKRLTNQQHGELLQDDPELWADSPDFAAQLHPCWFTADNKAAGYYAVDNGSYEDDTVWTPTTDPVANKALRAKLGERWDWILGQGKACQDEPPYGFALYEKGSRNDDYIAAAEAETEELAVVLCACKPYGIAVPK